jgi:dimethylamine/trimethylamine dehydrogenase
VTRDPRYDILFEPIPIGPVVAKNRFYQVPHCNGMGWTQPEALAALRGVKAEGGWAVVSTEEVEIHPTSDCEPFHEGRLWSDADIPALARMADAVHAHDALAAIEIIHHGASSANWGTREVPISPSHRPIIYYSPVQARAMDKQDIRDFRRWHRDAALRSKRAGFDIVYVYATHDLSLAMHFLQRTISWRDRCPPAPS